MPNLTGKHKVMGRIGRGATRGSGQLRYHCFQRRTEGLCDMAKFDYVEATFAGFVLADEGLGRISQDGLSYFVSRSYKVLRNFVRQDHSAQR
jgi:hypothetical protein